jgi:2'-5' RNA ligase
MADVGAPETALIIRVRLPRALEAIRRGAVVDADRGLPAHVTLLYPFAPEEALDGRLRTAVARALDRHSRFSFQLTGHRRWPETLYAAVEPEERFLSLHSDLAAAFPQYPLYGGAFEFVPHVTIAVGPAIDLARIATDPAWSGLPATLAADSVELIARRRGVWQTRWRFALRAPS